MIHAESPPTLVWNGVLVQNYVEIWGILKKKQSCLTLTHWWCAAHFSSKPALLSLAFKCWGLSVMWHPRVYGCETLIHSLPAKLTGTCWNSILWDILAVALPLVLTPKSSVMCLLDHCWVIASAFLIMNWLTPLGTVQMNVPAVRCDESHLSCQYWWKSESRRTARYTKVKI